MCMATGIDVVEGVIHAMLDLYEENVGSGWGLLLVDAKNAGSGWGLLLVDAKNAGSGWGLLLVDAKNAGSGWGLLLVDAKNAGSGWGLLLVDAKNAFNVVSRVTALLNARILWPRCSCFLINAYRGYSMLLLKGFEHILYMYSKEGLTQGDHLIQSLKQLSKLVH